MAKMNVLESLLILQATVIIILPQVSDRAILPKQIYTVHFFYNLVQLIQADYVLEVRAHTYQNSRHRDSNNDCCDIGFLSCGQCDNQFIFCLRGASTSNDGNPNNCPLGRYSTGEIGDDDFTFSSPIASGVPNPMTFTGSVWPVSMHADPSLSHYQCVNDDYAPINAMPHLPHPRQMWGIRSPLVLDYSVPRGESFARWLLKELKHELQYEILVACIAQN